MDLATTTGNLSNKAKEDLELVQLAVGGDQRAYQELMERYRPAIFQAMLKMVNNREDANDLTQEAFGKAFHNLANYAPRYAFSTWLFKIAINNGIDHIRKKRLPLLSIDEPIEPDSDYDFSSNLRAGMLNPEETIIRKQRMTLIRQVIGRLSDRYRLMIELRYFEELTYEEIANELSIPLGTVKAQLFRAKEMLYELLRQPGASAYFETTQRRK